MSTATMRNMLQRRQQAAARRAPTPFSEACPARAGEESRSCSWCTCRPSSRSDSSSCRSSASPTPSSGLHRSPSAAVLWLHGPVRELRGGARRGPRQGPGRRPARRQARRGRAQAQRGPGAQRASHVDDPCRLLPQLQAEEVTLCRLEEEGPVLRAGGRADPRRRRDRRWVPRRWTRAPSPASRPRSSARLAATAPPLPGAPPCFRTGWWCGLPADAGPQLPGPDDRHGGIGCPQEDAERDSRSKSCWWHSRIVFLIVSISLFAFSDFSANQAGRR